MGLETRIVTTRTGVVNNQVSYFKDEIAWTFQNNQQHPVDLVVSSLFRRAVLSIFLLNYDDLSRMRFDFSVFWCNNWMISIFSTTTALSRR